MDQAQFNTICGAALVALSLLALASVLGEFRKPVRLRRARPSQLFETTVLVMDVLVVTFLLTADWTRPMVSSRPLALCGLAVAATVGALYWQRQAAR